jgi:formate dehydrogenase assembly factor FdhD
MAVAEHPLAGLGYTHPSASRPLLRLGDEGTSLGSAIVAEEVPIALVYNGRPYVVVMGTPSDLEDLAFGFSRTEAVVDESSHIERLDVVRASHGIELQIKFPPPTPSDSKRARARWSPEQDAGCAAWRQSLKLSVCRRRCRRV